MFKPKKSIAAVDLFYLTKELQVLIGAKIDSIYQKEKLDLTLVFHLSSVGKKVVKIQVPDYLALIESKEAFDSPGGFCMFLRKHLKSARLQSVEQMGFERIVRFVFSTKTESYELYLEFIPPGNILLVKDKIILSAVHYEKFKARVIRPNVEYIYPTKEISAISLSQNDLKSLFEKTQKETLVTLLAIDLGLGGVYAEEFCLRAEIDKNMLPKEVDVNTVHQGLKELFSQNINAQLVETPQGSIDGIPFPFKLYTSLKTTSLPSFSDALEKYFTSQRPKIISGSQKREEKLHSILEAQQKALESITKEQEEYAKKGEWLYHHYQQLQSFLQKAGIEARKHGVGSLKNKIIDGIKIKNVNQQKKRIAIEMEER